MKNSYNGVAVPQWGSAIGWEGGRFSVPDKPVVPFIEGDGTGRDIWKASRRVFDAAVKSAYGGSRSVAWYEVFAGEKAYSKFQNWLPEETVDAARDFRVSIKGPLTTPVGGGIRSLNVTLRQTLDLYACIRPVRYYAGVPSPVKNPEKMNLVIFRENTEDVYIGVEWKEGSAPAKKLIKFLNEDMLAGTGKSIRLDSGVGIKPISITGTKRLVRMALQYAIDNQRRSVTLMHKGNIQKFTEGAFQEWGYEVATQEFRAQTVTERESWILGNQQANPNLSHEENARMIEPGIEFAPAEFLKKVTQEVADVLRQIGDSHGGNRWEKKILINDRIADSIFQQVVTRPDEYEVIATSNLNGDYISDACAAQVGGLGIAPGGNIGDGYAVFEATHGTAPKYADKDMINPGSVILSGVMMFNVMGWVEAARLIEDAMEATIRDKTVTYDFARQMENATKVGTSEFANCLIRNIERSAAG